MVIVACVHYYSQEYPGNPVGQWLYVHSTPRIVRLKDLPTLSVVSGLNVRHYKQEYSGISVEKWLVSILLLVLLDCLNQTNPDSRDSGLCPSLQLGISREPSGKVA